MSALIMKFKAVLRKRTIFSGSDFSKRPDPVQGPDPDLYKFFVDFFQKTIFAVLCPTKLVHEEKSSITWLYTIFMALIHTKKLWLGHFLGPESGSNQKGLDPKPWF
jgi:hypothetical protein